MRVSMPVTVAFIAVAFAAGLSVGLGVRADAKAQTGVIELRKYTANEGKLEALRQRMGGGEAKLFEKHGMKNVFHAIVADAPDSQNIYYYMLRHESREAAKKSWDAFRNDEAWKTLRAASEVNGGLVAKAEGTFLVPTDFSAVK